MKKIRIGIIGALLMAISMSLCACGSSKPSSQSVEWPTSGLATMLPVPTTLKGEIVTDNDSSFTADISKVTEDEYEEYVKACKDKGFTIDDDEGSSSFTAFNADGYKIRLNYHSDDEYYRINFDAPMYEEGETFIWPSTGLAKYIPEPATNIGRISHESSDFLSIYVGGSTIDDYNNYVDECIAAGFDVDYYRSDEYYDADNTAGVSLSVRYEGFNTFFIDINAFGVDLEELDDEGAENDEYTEFNWPDSDIAKLLPVPKSNIGKVEWEASYGFVIYVAETPKEDYDEYVNEVQNAGFDVDYHKTDTAFYADNEDGYHVYLRFDDNDIMFVRIDEPSEEDEEADEVEEETTEETEDSSSDSSSNLAGVSDEVKDALDSYENFIDDYIAFMEKYENSSDTSSMLSDYVDYMQEYSEMMEKINALGDSDMNAAETKYYAEVTLRCSKKLLDSLGE